MEKDRKYRYTISLLEQNIKINNDFTMYIGKVELDNGKIIDIPPLKFEKNIKIEIYGNKNFISVDCCENIKINGNVYNIKLTNGTITCDDIKNDVTITNGDIKSNRIFGKCNVINGDIKCSN